MYSYIFITHGNVGQEIFNTAQNIMKDDLTNICKVFSINLYMTMKLEKLQTEIKDCLDTYLLKKRKVIIFVDLFGGSSSNLAYTIVKPYTDGKHKDVDVISGINLSMVIHSIEYAKSSKKLDEMVEDIIRNGRHSITSAKRLLNKND